MEIKLRDFLFYSLLISNVMPEKSSLCSSKHNCSECIQTSSCAWCYDPNYNTTERCFVLSTEVLSLNHCSEEFIFNPDNQYRILQNAKFSGENNAQIRPQKIKISMRVEETVSVFLDYKEVTDYPIDVYYLMDSGQSIKDDQLNLGNHLSLALKRISTNFRLGFGTFSISKSENVSSERLEPSCGFHHHMSLSNDTSKFSDILRENKAFKNTYKLNEGLDAILQAIECRNQIGWRTEARRLLVVSTDTYFINEGNRKITENVGITQSTCNLFSNGSCSKVVSPTIEQINSSLRKNSVNAIFAVTMPVLDNYIQLVKNIEGATVGILSSDSSNIIELIRHHYMTISSIIEMKHTASDNVGIKFYTRCTNRAEKLINTNKCNNIKAGDVINYKIDIELLKCPKNVNDSYQTIQIYPVGINTRLIIDLEMQCRCPCEVSGHKYYQEHSPYCSYNGKYNCGVCECSPDFFGRNCECYGNLTETSCIRPPYLSYNLCSGRGACVCGKCICEVREKPAEKVYGQYCECDNFSCNRYNGKLCGEHGVCECGSCRCEVGWTGSSCECTTSTHSCTPPGDTQEQICSGHGICTCGICICHKNNEGGYSGRFCEKNSNMEIEAEIQIDETTAFTRKKNEETSNTNIEEKTNISMTSGKRKI